MALCLCECVCVCVVVRCRWRLYAEPGTKRRLTGDDTAQPQYRPRVQLFAVVDMCPLRPGDTVDCNAYRRRRPSSCNITTAAPAAGGGGGGAAEEAVYHTPQMHKNSIFMLHRQRP